MIGTEFDADIVARSVGRELDATLANLEHAAAAGLVHAVPGRPGRFSFAHRCSDAPPLRQHPTAHVPADPPRGRRRPHRHVTRRRGSAAGAGPPHASIAAPVGDPLEAIGSRCCAAGPRRALPGVERGHDAVSPRLQVAAAIAEPQPDLVLTLTIKLGEVLNGLGDPQSRQQLFRAATMARDTADPGALAEVALAMMRYGGVPAPGADPEFVALVEEALAGLGREPTALAQGRSPPCRRTSSSPIRTGPRSCSAKRWTLPSGRDPETLGHVLLSYRFAGKIPGNEAAGHPTANRLITLGRRTGYTPFVLHGLVQRAWTFRDEGDLTSADRAMSAARALLGDEPAPIYITLFTLYRSSQLLLAGDLAGAEQAANEVLTLATTGFDPTLWYGPALMAIRGHQGRLGELIPLLEAATDHPAFGGSYQAVLASAYAFAGQLDDARSILTTFSSNDFRNVRRNQLWLTDMTSLAETADILGHRAAAAAIAEQLNPFAGRIAALPATVVSTVDFVLAQMALVTGDHHRARQHAEHAVSASRQRNTPVFLGRELLRLAAARQRLGESADDTRDLVTEALAIADRTGATLIEHEAHRLGLVDATTS